MLVTLLRVFTWLWAGYAVLVNVLAVVAALVASESPWEQIAWWYNPRNFTNWRYQARLFSPAVASHFLAQWLSRRS